MASHCATASGTLVTVPPLTEIIKSTVSDDEYGDPRFTLDYATPFSDPVQASNFRSWALNCRLQMKFDGAGEILSLGWAEALRTKLGTAGTTYYGLPTQAVPIKRIEVEVKIFLSIKISCVIVPSAVDGLFVHRMFHYLTGTAVDMPKFLGVFSVLLPHFPRTLRGYSPALARFAAWYSLSILSTGIMFHADYVVVLADCSDEAMEGPLPCARLKEILRININILPLMPYLFLNNALPHKIAVTNTPLVKDFITFVRDVPFSESGEAQ